MKKEILFLLWLVLLLGFWGISGNAYECDAELAITPKEKVEPLWFPVVKAFVKTIVDALDSPVGVSLSLELGYDFCVAVDCNCEPCCPPPPSSSADFQVTVAIAGEVYHETGSTLRPGGVVTTELATNTCSKRATEEKPICFLPSACTACFPAGGKEIGIRVGPLDRFLGASKALVKFELTLTCACQPEASYCLRPETNHPPMLSVAYPAVFQEGGERLLLVNVKDEERDVVEIRATDNFGRNLFPLAYSYDNEGRIVGAWIEVPLDAKTVAILAEDRCRNTTRIKDILIHVNHPVTLTVTKTEWKDGIFYVEGVAYDQDLVVCARTLDIVEKLTFKTSFITSGGGEFWGPPGFVQWTSGCLDYTNGEVPFTAIYIPPSRGKPRLVYLFISVKDNWGASDSWSYKLVNEPPTVEISEVFPPARSPVKVRYGEMVVAKVSAHDHEGDQIVLQKDFGPGDFAPIEGKAAVSGTYRWTAQTPQRWHLVRFSATDVDVEPPKSNYAYLLIQVLQPPLVSNPHVWIQRGETTRAFVYVSDPDSLSHTFSFTLPEGMRVWGLGQVEPPDYYGNYFGHIYAFGISANVCDGIYSIPFTVTDPDGLSAEGVLTVHVFGNRSPQVKGELFGEATVVLYPDRAEVSPVVVRGEVFDPDGDQVFVEAPGIPPQYAANLSSFLGSFVSVYLPYFESD